jgi:hypothetical protein
MTGFHPIFINEGTIQIDHPAMPFDYNMGAQIIERQLKNLLAHTPSDIEDFYHR